MTARAPATAIDFDAAADEALEEIRENINQWTAKDIAAWWKRWYMTAGHKRLGRILVKLV